jgi:Rrf2 family transcriptional regulator, iron-sulfur cluster assembly transcription factor
VDPADMLRSPLCSRNCQDALRVMERLASATLGRPGSGRSLSALASESGMALPTLKQLAYFLRLAGIMSRRGPPGALQLARPPSEISMLEVIRAIDGAGLWRHCLMGLAECSDAAPCPVHTAWKSARRVLEQHLEAQTIADLTRAVALKRRVRQSRASSRRGLGGKRRRSESGS